MAEPMKMPFGMLSRVGPWNMYYMGCGCPHEKRTFGGVWPIKKHCKAYDFWGWVKGELSKKWVDQS